MYRFGLMPRFHLKAVLFSLILLPTVATAQASETEYFERAAIAFKRICIDTLPNFRGGDRAARNLGIDSFRKDRIGEMTGLPRTYAYNFEIPANEDGLNWASEPGHIAIEFGPSSDGSDNSCSVEYFEPFGGLTKARASSSFIATMETFLTADKFEQANSTSEYLNFYYDRFPGQVRISWAGDTQTAASARVTFNLWLGDVNKH